MYSLTGNNIRNNRVHIRGTQALYVPEFTVKSWAPGESTSGGGGTVNSGTVTSMDGCLALKDISMSRSKDI